MDLNLLAATYGLEKKYKINSYWRPFIFLQNKTIKKLNKNVVRYTT